MAKGRRIEKRKINRKAILLVVGVLAILGVSIWAIVRTKNTGIDPTDTQAIGLEKAKKFPEIFSDNKLELVPPQSYQRGHFSINPMGNNHIIVDKIGEELSFSYLVDTENVLQVTIEQDNFGEKQGKKQLVDGIEIYSEKNGKEKDFVVYQDYGTIRIQGKEKFIKKYIGEIMKAISYHENGNDSRRIESGEVTRTIGKYLLDFSQNAYAYQWEVNETGENNRNMVEIRYMVPSEQDENATSYIVGMYGYYKEDGMARIEKKNMAEEATFQTELVKLPLANYEFYVEKKTNKSNKTVKYESVYLLLEEQIIEFVLDRKENEQDITNERAIIDMLQKQVINQVIFLP